MIPNNQDVIQASQQYQNPNFESEIQNLEIQQHQQTQSQAKQQFEIVDKFEQIEPNNLEIIDQIGQLYINYVKVHNYQNKNEIIKYIKWVNMNRQMSSMTKHWPQIRKMQILYITKVYAYQNKKLKLLNTEDGSIWLGDQILSHRIRLQSVIRIILYRYYQ